MTARDLLTMAGRLWACRRIDVALRPGPDVEVCKDGCRSRGKDPYFEIALSRPLGPGFLLVSYHARLAIDDMVFRPRLYYKGEGGGYTERDKLILHAHSAGVARHLLYLPQVVTALRFDPLEIDAQRGLYYPIGHFAVTEFKLSELGIFAVIGLCLGSIFVPGRRRVQWRRLIRRHRTSRRFRKALQRCCYQAIQPVYDLRRWYLDYRSRPRSAATGGQRGVFGFVACAGDDGLLRLAQRVSAILRSCGDFGRLYLGVPSAWRMRYWLCTAAGRLFPRRICIFRQCGKWTNPLNAELAKIVREPYLIYLQPGAVPDADGLGGIQGCLQDEPDVVLVDEIHFDARRRACTLLARPAFSLDAFLARPMLGGGFAVRTGLLAAIDVHRDGPGADTLRALDIVEAATGVCQVSDIGVRVYESGRSAYRVGASGEVRARIGESLRRWGFPSASVNYDSKRNAYRIRYDAPTAGRVAVIVPTRNGRTLLRKCVAAIERLQSKRPVDLVIVDHMSDAAFTLEYLEHARQRHTVIRYVGPFNFAAINNYAVRALAGKHRYLLFMNDDVEAMGDDWFDDLLDKMGRKDVGVAGASLRFPDGTVQHAGVVVGLQGCASHVCKGESVDGIQAWNSGLIGMRDDMLVTREWSAVTAACMMVRREVFDKLDGFDERFAVGFNDTDFCLRARRLGYKVLNVDCAGLVHHESQSRGTIIGDPHPEDSRLFAQTHAELLRRGDPYYSPLLSRRAIRPMLYLGLKAPKVPAVHCNRDFAPQPNGGS